MSIATALSSHSIGGYISNTRLLPRTSVGHRSSSHQTSALHQEACSSDALHNWNGLVFRRAVLRTATENSRLNKFFKSSAVVSGLPSLKSSGIGRSLCRGGRFIHDIEHRMFSGPLLSTSTSTTISRSRIAYGFFLGPAYGYGGGFGFGGGGSVFLLIILGFLAVQAFSRTDEAGGGFTRTGEKVSVLKLQVGLLGIARNLQSDLERIADRADTSTTRGLHYVLTETVLALLRQPDMCILGTSSADTKRSVEAGERRFNQLSLEERGKFDEETLVNVDGNRKRDAERARGDGFGNEYIVVTVLVAAEGEYKLPAIYSNDDMREALKTLGSIPADRLQGVEILWTPQDKNDTLTERDLLQNYPLLKSL